MELQNLREIVDREGPFVTVYLEARSPSEDAWEQVRLRWKSLRQQLEDQGGWQSLIDLVEERITGSDPTEVLASGRVVVATGDGDASGESATVLLDEAWDAALGSGDAAHVSAQPELGPYIRAASNAVRVVAAIVNQREAVIRSVVAADTHSIDEESETHQDSEVSESVHKPRGNALSHKQIQRRADEAVQKNARGIADHIEDVAGRWNPEVIVLAGESQGRTAVRDEFPESLVPKLRETSVGSIDDAGAEDALAEELREIAAEVASDRAERNTERFEAARARNQVATGTRQVNAALGMGAVDTLLLYPAAHAPHEAELLGECARTGADVEVMSGDPDDADDPVAAVLRFEAPAEVTSA